MDLKPRSPEQTYGPALERAREALPRLEPGAAAERAAVTYQASGAGHGQFQVPFFGAIHEVHWPGGEVWRAADGVRADITTQIVVLHYLLTADGSPMAEKWIAFRSLPGGLGYDAAFQGRANRRLAQAFGTDRAAFETAARSLGGESLSFGDAAFAFRVLPRVWLAVVLNLADDEFAANANVLFDAAASHYLPTEDLAVLGGSLAGRLIKGARAKTG